MDSGLKEFQLSDVERRVLATAIQLNLINATWIAIELGMKTDVVSSALETLREKFGCRSEALIDRYLSTTFGSLAGGGREGP